jgi:hypothetical protein
MSFQTAIDAWRKRAMTVRTLTRCEECGQLKENVVEREYWTMTGKKKHTCCESCGRDLHYQYYPKGFVM